MDMVARMMDATAAFSTKVMAATATDANYVHGVDAGSNGNINNMDSHGGNGGGSITIPSVTPAVPMVPGT